VVSDAPPSIKLCSPYTGTQGFVRCLGLELAQARSLLHCSVSSAFGGTAAVAPGRPGGLLWSHGCRHIAHPIGARERDYLSGSPALCRPSKRCSASSERLKGHSRACVRS